MAYACSSSISPAHQLFAGLEGLLHGGSRTTDALAALSYFAEATMFAFEVFVFKTTTIEAAAPAIDRRTSEAPARGPGAGRRTRTASASATRTKNALASTSTAEISALTAYFRIGTTRSHDRRANRLYVKSPRGALVAFYGVAKAKGRPP